MKAHIDTLLDAASSAEREVFLVAPFVKEAIARGLLQRIRPEVDLTLVTRWRPDEVLAGVSDVAVYDALEERRKSGPSTQFRLLDALHAKYYRFDDQVLVGSANLTATGLGVFGNALEILMPTPQSALLLDVEVASIERSIVPSEEVVAAFRELASRAESVDGQQRLLGDEADFFPTFRNPKELWDAVTEVDYPVALRESALTDIHALAIPLGITSSLFEAAVAAAFGASPLVNNLRAFCFRPRRFGEVRQWVSLRSPYLEDSKSAAQTLLRWLTHFLPNEFSVRQANYSEILYRY